MEAIAEVDARALKGASGAVPVEVADEGLVDVLADVLADGSRPVVLRGLVQAWPVVQAAQTSRQALAAYLLGFYRGATVDAWLGEPAIGGRFFYDATFTGFNFQRLRLRLDEVLAQLEAYAADGQAAGDTLAADARPPALYVGSTTVDTCLPGFREAHALDLGPRDALASLWLGNQARVAAHYDLPDNLACVAAGRRRFTLFPPEQIGNLYVGPLDLTPAGQAISLVDLHAPDLARYPRFAQALAAAQVAELDPGDALFIPSLWWHHVESLDPMNLLVNYWWRDVPAHMDNPTHALMHAMLSIRGLPPAQRAAWASLFRHHVFEAGEATVEHIPLPARGVLAPLTPEAARGLRAWLLRKLNR